MLPGFGVCILVEGGWSWVHTLLGFASFEVFWMSVFLAWILFESRSLIDEREGRILPKMAVVSI